MTSCPRVHEQPTTTTPPTKPAPPVTSALTRRPRPPSSRAPVGHPRAAGRRGSCPRASRPPRSSRRARRPSRRPRRPPRRPRHRAGPSREPSRLSPTTTPRASDRALDPRVGRHARTLEDERAVDHRAGMRGDTPSVEHVGVGAQVRRRGPGVEPVGLVGVREERALVDHRREDLALDGHGTSGCDAREERRLEDVGAGVDSLFDAACRGPASPRTRHPPVLVGHDDAVAARVLDGRQLRSSPPPRERGAAPTRTRRRGQ